MVANLKPVRTVRVGLALLVVDIARFLPTVYFDPYRRILLRSEYGSTLLL